MLAALLLAGAGPGREALGVFGGWGAFRDRRAERCFAIAVPAHTAGRPAWRPFASVASWPGRRHRDMVFVQMSVIHAPNSPVTLSVGERRFGLSGSGRAAWSPDAATDHAIVAALRGERSFSVAGVDSRGEPFADTYLLAGAATAIDAATLACAAAATN